MRFDIRGLLESRQAVLERTGKGLTDTTLEKLLLSNLTDGNAQNFEPLFHLARRRPRHRRVVVDNVGQLDEVLTLQLWDQDGHEGLVLGDGARGCGVLLEQRGDERRRRGQDEPVALESILLVLALDLNVCVATVRLELAEGLHQSSTMLDALLSGVVGVHGLRHFSDGNTSWDTESRLTLLLLFEKAKISSGYCFFSWSCFVF